MKDRAHHLKHVQRKVIQDVKRQEQEKQRKQAEESTAEPVFAGKIKPEDEHLSEPRGVDRTNIYRNRSHQGFH